MAMLDQVNKEYVRQCHDSIDAARIELKTAVEE